LLASSAGTLTDAYFWARKIHKKKQGTMP